jgi:DHA1 family tetracycline resistance protein-like MFS transporter
MAALQGSTAEVRSPKRAIAVVVGIVFVDLLGFGVVIPILPFYVRSSPSATPSSDCSRPPTR